LYVSSLWNLNTVQMFNIYVGKPTGIYLSQENKHLTREKIN